MSFMRTAASDLLDIGCRRYNSMQSCISNLPEAMQVFDQLMMMASDAGNGSRIITQKYSPVIPLIEISRRIADVAE